jgi:hypothetical protein
MIINEIGEGVKGKRQRRKKGEKKEKKIYIGVVASRGVFSSKTSCTHLSAMNSIMGNKVVSHSAFSSGECHVFGLFVGTL